jgi:hypothetical protein
MKEYGGTDVHIQVSLTSALVGGEWSTSRPGRITPGRKIPRYPLDKRLGGPQNRTGRRGEEKINYINHKWINWSPNFMGLNRGSVRVWPHKQLLPVSPTVSLWEDVKSTMLPTTAQVSLNFASLIREQDPYHPKLTINLHFKNKLEEKM